MDGNVKSCPKMEFGRLKLDKPAVFGEAVEIVDRLICLFPKKYLNKIFVGYVGWHDCSDCVSVC